jgi:2-phosphosulfolactate phosphatase
MNSQTQRTVVIDCFPENVERWRNEGYAVVAVDVIRATTTAVTAVAMGRKCYPVATLEQALSFASGIDNPLMVGEIGGDMPEGFEIPNSPADVAEHNDLHRPMVLLSTSGTKIISAAKGSVACYVACLRNYTAQVGHLIKHHLKVAVIGAGTRGEFREEDQLCCAWIAEGLVRAGYTPGNDETEKIIRRWQNAPVEALLVSNSVAYLKRSGQTHDLDFVLEHIDDVPAVFELQANEIVMLPTSAYAPTDGHGFSKPKVEDAQLNVTV